MFFFFFSCVKTAVTAKSLAKLKTLLEKGHEAGETLKLKIEFLEKLEATIKDKEAFSKVLETVDRVLDEVEQQLWDNQGRGLRHIITNPGDWEGYFFASYSLGNLCLLFY